MALAAAIKVILNNDSSALRFQLSGEIPELLEKRPCALRRPWKDKQRSSVALLKVLTLGVHSLARPGPCFPHGPRERQGEFTITVKGSRLQRGESTRPQRETAKEHSFRKQGFAGGPSALLPPDPLKNAKPIASFTD